MSGVGTIPIEVSELGRHVFSLGGEIDAEIAVRVVFERVTSIYVGENIDTVTTP